MVIKPDRDSTDEPLGRNEVFLGHGSTTIAQVVVSAAIPTQFKDKPSVCPRPAHLCYGCWPPERKQRGKSAAGVGIDDERKDDL